MQHRCFSFFHPFSSNIWNIVPAQLSTNQQTELICIYGSIPAHLISKHFLESYDIGLKNVLLAYFVSNMKDFEFYTAPKNANLKFYKLHDLGLWRQLFSHVR